MFTHDRLVPDIDPSDVEGKMIIEGKRGSLGLGMISTQVANALRRKGFMVSGENKINAGILAEASEKDILSAMPINSDLNPGGIGKVGIGEIKKALRDVSRK